MSTDPNSIDFNALVVNVRKYVEGDQKMLSEFNCRLWLLTLSAHWAADLMRGWVVDPGFEDSREELISAIAALGWAASTISCLQGTVSVILEGNAGILEEAQNQLASLLADTSDELLAAQLKELLERGAQANTVEALNRLWQSSPGGEG